MTLRSHVVHLATLAVLGSAAIPARAATTGDNGTHDPSRIIESDGRFYFCGTGGRCASSADGLAWKSTGLRISIPAWAAEYMNDNGQTQGVWAPDIIFYGDQYYIYYSFCGQPGTHAPCAIGLYTTPTLDSTSPRFKLTDVGKVVNNPPNTTGFQFSTIDPAPAIDASGKLWTSWGSGYGKDTSKLQIYVTRLGEDGLPLTSDAGYQPPMTLGYGLETGGIEGSYVHYRDGYYHLFWNSGGCCSGASSTYTVHVARSSSISGPYTGAKVWYQSSGSMHGPGHVGIYSACGVERFTYHYYPDSGGSVLGENELSWDKDGWPVPGAASTTPLVPCGNPSGGGGNGGTSTGGSAGGGGDNTGGARAGGGGVPNIGGAAGASGTGNDVGSPGGAGRRGQRQQYGWSRRHCQRGLTHRRRGQRRRQRNDALECKRRLHPLASWCAAAVGRSRRAGDFAQRARTTYFFSSSLASPPTGPLFFLPVRSISQFTVCSLPS